MSLDCLIVNLDRREFFRPLDMGLGSDIRVVEGLPSLFHVAVIRILESHRTWYGQRVGIIHEASDVVPTWDGVMSRFEGWKNILPAVIGMLVLDHRPGFDQMYGGTKRDLMRTLKSHIKDLEGEFEEAKHDVAEDPHGWDSHLPEALHKELVEGKETYARLSKHLKREKRGGA
jgi:hypothetical protein